MEKLRKGGIAFQLAESGFHRSTFGPHTADVGKDERARIAGAGFDANMAAPAGKTEDQDHVGLFRPEGAQIAGDRPVTRRKKMAHDLDPGERGTAAARQRNRQAAAWIRRHTGKRAETGDDHAHPGNHVLSIAAIFSTAEAGASFPAATSASMRGKAVLSARSERNGSNNR